MYIDVWSDVACPWCYLGLRHLRSALAAFDHRDEIEVSLHAYFLDPELDGVLDAPRRVYLIEEAGMTLDEAVTADERLIALGSQEGVAFDFDHAIVAPTSNAHRVIAAAHEFDLECDTVTGPDTTQLRVAEALGRAYFEMGFDVSDPDVCIGCAQDNGMPVEQAVAALADERWAAQVFSDYQIGIQMGIDLVPTYLFDRRLVVQNHQSLTAMGNILAGAWSATAKEPS